MEQISFKSCSTALRFTDSNKLAKISNFTITNCQIGFKFNSRPRVSFAYVKNGKFLNGGNGVYVSASNVNIELNNTVFEGMQYGFGGESGRDGGKFLMNNVYFQNNGVHIWNTGFGTWRLTNMIFNNGSFRFVNIDVGVSSAIFMKVTSFNVEKSKVIISDSSYESGVGINLSNSDLLLKKCTFEENRGVTNLSGGAITIKQTVIAISDCQFLNNEGGRAGAIYCESGNGNVFETDFRYNIGRDKGSGGAFFCESSCEFFMVSNNYLKNEPKWRSDKCEMN